LLTEVAKVETEEGDTLTNFVCYELHDGTNWA